MLGGVIDPDYQGDIRLFLYNGVKEDDVCSAGDPLGHLLVLSHPVITFNGKLQQLNPGRVTKGTDMSGMKVWVSHLVKEPRASEVLVEDGGTTEYIVKEGSYQYQLGPGTKIITVTSISVMFC